MKCFGQKRVMWFLDSYHHVKMHFDNTPIEQIINPRYGGDASKINLLYQAQQTEMDGT